MMSEKGTENNRYAADTIENEGIGYAVLHYCSGDVFSDPKTRELWNEACEALEALETYLRDGVGVLD